MLDLFMGTWSVARVQRGRGFTVVTLDFGPATNPDILVDILQWDYQSQFTPGDFHTAFAPTLHRVLNCKNHRSPRDYELADSIVTGTLEIIE